MGNWRHGGEENPFEGDKEEISKEKVFWQGEAGGTRPGRCDARQCTIELRLLFRESCKPASLCRQRRLPRRLLALGSVPASSGLDSRAGLLSRTPVGS